MVNYVVKRSFFCIGLFVIVFFAFFVMRELKMI